MFYNALFKSPQIKAQEGRSTRLKAINTQLRINVQKIFKLAGRMRSMRTNGASKNRVVFVCLTFAKNGDDFPLFSIWIIFGTYGICTYGMCTYGKYTYSTYA